MKKRPFIVTRATALAAGATKFLFKSQLFTVLLVLCSIGYWAGTQARPKPGTVPFEELFENLSVLSYRDAPSDSMPHFVVELSAGGRVFQQYDVDSHRFMEPVRGHDYRRSITGTRYSPLKVSGHVNRGFWFELPNAPTPAIRTDQFDELYRSSLEYLKPASIVASALAVLSGYSTGYRLAIWSSSLSNPKVQERVITTPGIDRVIAREAWRRVLLEPVIVGRENDATRFASVRGTQRIYTNFFRLALNDSDSFIPREVARLDSAGHGHEARAMQGFARAVRRASQDSCYLASEDFVAVEEWASLLDRRGHWADGSTPPRGEERMKYLGTLAWYGIAPASSDEQRIWVGPRVLVRTGESEGFVADEIPLTPVGCPVAWREWLRDDGMGLSANAWTAQWMGNMKQFKPIVQIGRTVAAAFDRGDDGGEKTRLAATGTATAAPPVAGAASPGRDSSSAAAGGVAAAFRARVPGTFNLERRISVGVAKESQARGADSVAALGAVGVATQRADSVILDASGKPLEPPVVKGEEVGIRGIGPMPK